MIGRVFYYFGYGSNLSVVSLRAKGVEPLTSEPAVLAGWRLVFDIPDFFAIEGGTGNIEPREGDAVHGVLHGCRSRDLATLDQLEALGTRYRRVETTVMTYAGRTARAYVYLGIADVLDPSCLPSERYKNILVRGAVDMHIEARYIERLRAIETCPRTERGSFTPPPDAEEEFTLDRLRESPSCVALAGRVFDMSGARESHVYLRRLLGGKDATLLFLKRMDTSTGVETIHDVMHGTLSPAQREYTNAYLHEFAREYRCIGTLAYSERDSQAPELLGGSPRRSSPALRPSMARQSWVPPHGMSSAPPSGIHVAGRAVIERAERARAEHGHENLGFLSSVHGYMPADLPRATLPRAYEAWDQLAAELPELYRSLRLRRACDALPVLPADVANLPDDALLRAALILGAVSHAYRYVETSLPERQPAALSVPWAEVRTRLGRSHAVLTYQDLIVYNWRLLDPTRTDPMALDNMRLLVPTVDNQEERVFYLTQTQILAHASPMVSAVVAAQEAVVLDDAEALESALMTIIGSLQRIVRESLLKINPNPEAATYVDPVVWAKTVAPFAVPMEEGIPGPSGTSSPIFNTLDVFFGRKRYETFLGREIHQLRGTYPPFWREFIAAIHEISVADYVATRGNAHLSGLLHEARSLYAGPNGFLGRHRMKVYGYLELAFKVGRSVTIGGFKGVFRDRTWDQVDAELERSRVERVQSFPQSCYHARVKSVEGASHGVFDVVLDVSGTGVRYEAGDRCGVLPENEQSLVMRTLTALGATGDERVALSAEWREAIRLRRGHESALDLPLADLLRFGQLRPVSPRVAEALHAMTQNEVLEKAMRAGTMQDWELHEVLDMLRAGGFDPKRLVSGDAPGKSATSTGQRPRYAGPARSVTGPLDDNPSLVCEIAPPESFRMYSISSVVSSAETQSATELRLTVSKLTYRDRVTDRERHGVASSFLAAANPGDSLAIVIQHPPRFGLPRDARTPVVMIAGGTGISPFRGFLAERQRQLASAKSWLLLGVRSRAEMVWADDLAPMVQAGQLRVEIAFSRDDVGIAWNEQGWSYTEGVRRHIGDLLQDEDIAARLWDLVRPVADGGSGAHVFVCGRTRFAKSAIAALKDVFVRFAPGPPEERVEYAEQLLRDLAADGRFMQEIFSGEAAHEDLPPIDISQIARHNDSAHGYWVVIEDRVYDLTEYVRHHPGGMRVLLGYAGTDATDGYTRAHHARSEIDATREMYVVGLVRALDLRGVRVPVEGAGGIRHVSLAGIHRGWVKNLYLSVEMQNALRNDQSLQKAVTTRDDPASPRSPYKLQKAVETHERFVKSYLEGLANESFPSLWALTAGAFSREADEGAWMTERLDAVRSGPAARFVEAMTAELYSAIARIAGNDGASDDAEIARIERSCEILEEEAQRFLGDVKITLRDGVRVFEEHERETPERGAEALIGICKRLPSIMQRFHAALSMRLRYGEGWAPQVSTPDPAERSQRPTTAQTLLLCTRYWFVEESAVERVVVLRRTPLPFDSLEALVAENASVIATIRGDHLQYGLVVDMRQAPPRNDPEFEDAMRTLRETIAAGFARHAVLLESSAGVLQVNRLGRGEGQRVFATMSESAAVTFAKGES
jgi:sulfite reductase alpha subunit-like flavoprotein